MMLLSVEANPVQALINIAIVVYPLMNRLQIKDLKKIDPYNTLLRGNKRDDVLPRSGLSTSSIKKETKE